MQYLSTRDKTLRLSAAEAIKMGLSRDGGLFTPVHFPTLGSLDLNTLCGLSYQRRAAYIMGKYVEHFRPEELNIFAARAYGPEKFDHPDVAPLHRMDGNTWCLELWHGPTSAFKDMALQMLPQLISASLRITGEEKAACILVATSGDTGKAAMEGFADVDQTKILVFYPEKGVSEIQKLQMVTQEGGNVGVCAVKGNFDDAQNGVKRIFSDPAIREELAGRGCFLSSANSINWGRILPQIVYYISAYCDLLNAKEIKLGQKVNYCVPTGNFGNILACYYAKRMGLPVGKLICASNRNDVLTDFIRTGVYDRNRPFHTTMSPSMDILISSNLERLIFDLSGGDDELVRSYMDQLARTGRYEIGGEMKERLQELFYGGFCGEEETAASIGMLYQYGYLIDPHTAVAAKVLTDYRHETGDKTPAIFVSTASPYKFCDSVLSAIGETPAEDSVERIAQMEAVTGTAAPARLAALKGKTPRFGQVTERENMERVVLEFLK
ncbi:MAG: threonine synthase [Oscillospiraceae bacterium]|jgi:threonine synthase|nr:threonine synthase [Oscillospiraceae bacterium]